MPGRASRGSRRRAGRRAVSVESTRSRSRAGRGSPDRRHGRRCRRSTAGRAGTPRPLIGRPPAGWTSSSTSRPVAGREREARAVRHDPARLVVGIRRRDRRRPGRPAAGRRSRGRSPATAGRPGPGARARPPGRAGSSRPSSRRSGRVSVAPSARLRRRRGARRRSQGSERAARAARRPRSRGAPRGPARSRPRRATDVLLGDDRPVSRPASIRISVTPVSSSPARIVAGIGVAPRWRGRSDGWRLSAPWRQVRGARRARSGRSRRGRRGPDRAPRTSAIAAGSRSRSGARTSRPELAGLRLRPASASRSRAARPAAAAP